MEAALFFTRNVSPNSTYTTRNEAETAADDRNGGAARGICANSGRDTCAIPFHGVCATFWPACASTFPVPSPPSMPCADNSGCGNNKCCRMIGCGQGKCAGAIRQLLFKDR